jgi:hypothetical protein
MRGDFQVILDALTARGVDFIVVGGIGAALQGAPVVTFDLDIVHSRKPENVKRLLAALHELGACYREQSAKRLTPSAADLAGSGHHLLMTRAGPLDVLGAVTKGRVYDDLMVHTVEMGVTPKKRFRVLDLPTLITLKEELGRDKDLATLSLLRRTLQERGDG